MELTRQAVSVSIILHSSTVICSFQIIKDLHLFGVVGVLIVIDAIFLFNWNFLDPLQMKTKYLPTYVSVYSINFCLHDVPKVVCSSKFTSRLIN